jgi:mevalonate pyrophosphate decarboxylase
MSSNINPKQCDIAVGYRIDGGPESPYSQTKEEANEIFKSIEECFGEAVIWEITEQYDEINDWEIIDENIIRSTN